MNHFNYFWQESVNERCFICLQNQSRETKEFFDDIFFAFREIDEPQGKKSTRQKRRIFVNKESFRGKGTRKINNAGMAKTNEEGRKK